MAEEITKKTKLSEQTIYNEAILRFMVALSTEDKRSNNTTETFNEAKRFADKYMDEIMWLDAPNEPE